MKSIPKTIKVDSISNLALVGILSILVSACGSEDPSNPRAYDTTGPEIIMAGDAIVLLDINDEYVELGATARDVWDGDTIVDQDPDTPGIQGVATDGVDSVDTSSEGIHKVTYTAEDSSGNISQAIRTIDVADRTAPVISISGSNPLLVPLNGTFELPEATFVDAFDVSQNEAPLYTISSSGDVTTSVLGTYTVTYTAADNSGNEATATLTVVVEPDYQDEVVIFQNGTVTPEWQPGLNGYDQDNGWGACPDPSACPNLDFGIVNDSERDDVVFVSHADTEALAGFFIETQTPNDLRGAAVNGKLEFDIWSESGVSVNVSADCVYPCQGGPVLIENVGDGAWETVAIPASQLMTNGLNSVSMENVSTFSISADGMRNASFRLDNIKWLCELSCTGTD